MTSTSALAIATVLLLAGCAPVEGPAYESAGVAPGKAHIYSYRTYPALAYHAEVQMPVKCGNDSVLLGPGGYVVFTVDPGEIQCSSQIENTASADIHVQAGQDYYLRGWASMGIVTAHVNLELVDGQIAQAQISECKKQ